MQWLTTCAILCIVYFDSFSVQFGDGVWHINKVLLSVSENFRFR
jgi:hypothetical protein